MKVTREDLEIGRGKDGFSDAQLRIFGFTEDNCEGWIDKVLGDEVTLYKMKMFQGMKDWIFVDRRNIPATIPVIPSSTVNENTRRMFELGKSSHNGYNKWQLKVLGITWQTLKKGWMKRLLRNEYSKETMEKFIFYKDLHLKNKNLK